MRQGPSNDLHAGLPDGSSLLVPEGGVRLPHFPPVSGTALRSGSQFWMGPGARSRNCGSRLAHVERAFAYTEIRGRVGKLIQRGYPSGSLRFWSAFDPPPGDAFAVSTALADVSWDRETWNNSISAQICALLTAPWKPGQRGENGMFVDLCPSFGATFVLSVGGGR